MKRQPEAVFAIATARLSDIADTLARRKSRVTFRPETMGKGALMGTLDETIALEPAD